MKQLLCEMLWGSRYITEGMSDLLVKEEMTPGFLWGQSDPCYGSQASELTSVSKPFSWYYFVFVNFVPVSTVWPAYTTGLRCSRILFSWPASWTIPTCNASGSPEELPYTSLQEHWSQNSPLTSESTCSVPSNTVDFLLASHCKCLCRKTTSINIFLLLILLTLRDIWHPKMRRSVYLGETK